MNYSPQTTQPAGGGSCGLASIGKNECAAGLMIPRSRAAVKPGAGLLVDQAAAAEARALATAAWHRERAGRYLAWTDLEWCAAQYAHHVEAAELQERLAARHRAIGAALGEVRHG